MLRKVSHIVISLLLLTSTMGLTLSAHYCGENLKSVSILADSAPCCDIPDGCCHDEASTYRINDDFASTSFNFESKLILTQVLDYVIPVSVDLSAKHFPTQVFEEPPPRSTLQVLSDLQIYIL